MGNNLCMPSGRVIKVGNTYRHFKGHLYRVADFAVHTETNEILVLYYEVGSPDIKMWARPLNMFDDLVDTNKYPYANQQYRFEEIKTVPTLGLYQCR